MTLKHYLLLAVFHLLSFVGCRAQNSVAPMNIGNVFMKFGETETSVPIKLTSWGKSDARSITYTLYYMETGENVGPTTFTFDQPITYGETREVIFPIKTGTKLGTADVILNITEVNGQYNEATIGSIYITCCTVNKIPHKRVLVEDYAAMWCWHCPIGLVATDAIARMYPEDVVPVSVHKTDAISQAVSYSVYDGLIAQYANTLPAVWIARDTKAAGYDVTDAFKIEKERVTCMNIDVEAQWDETNDNIRVTTQVEPCMAPAADDTYAIGYVLTASGLTNEQWVQEANYSEYASDTYKDAPEEMKFYADINNYVEGYSKVKGVVFNHVAIESQGMQRGLANSLTGSFYSNEVKKHSTIFHNISKYSVISDRSKIEIVAVLFNTKTRKIENAARCYVGDGKDGPTGIEQITRPIAAKNSGIYDLQGRGVSGKPQAGMYIVNGKKMMIK